MLRRLAITLGCGFLLALFLPLALPGPPRAASHTSSVMRLAPIVVDHLLPATLAAQATDTIVQPDSTVAAPAESGGHSARFWAAIVALVAVAAWGSWRFASRGDKSASGP